MHNEQYDEGMRACELGKRKSSNPYNHGTDAWRDWNNGYDYAASVADDEF
jgi:hypothetical protein